MKESRLYKSPAVQVVILFAAWLIGIFAFPCGLSADEGEVPLKLDDSRFRIEIPPTVLSGVPVAYVKITALDANGNVDTSYHGKRPLIQGVKLTIRDSETGQEKDTAIEPFQNGVLHLKTDLRQGRKVYIIASKILVDPDSRTRGEKDVVTTNRWFSILPPLLAVGLAIWLRNVLVAMFAAIWCGTIILARGDFFAGFMRALDTYLIQEIVRASDSGEHSHLLIILFTMFLGAMIGVMARSGGTRAIVNGMARFTKNREQGQLMTWAMGFVIFFDDYANTLLVGGTMRPVTDKLRISREKLAFLVDSTAAPVAGLAIISTWVGVEVGYIQSTYNQLFPGTGMEWNAYSTFLATIPFRFYPVHLLVFVMLIAYIGNDYGPMLRAEARALKHGQMSRLDANVDAEALDHSLSNKESDQAPRLRTAIVPLVVLIGLIMIGLWWTGSEGLATVNQKLAAEGKPPIEKNFWTILQESSSNRVMFVSAFLASVSAIGIAIASKALKLSQAIDAWATGAKSMFFALIVLVLAWTIATLCDAEHLNTAGFLVELAGGRVSAAWTPTLAFLLSAAVAFATGSSFTTMGLLMPLFITMTFYLLSNDNDLDPNHPIMLGTIGAVLAGAIFGDHCSPISDTTVLSSAASGCDHLDHVATQFPYAISVALVALLFGYVPIGFGISPLILLPLGVLTMYIIVQFFGKPVADYADQLEDAVIVEKTDSAKSEGDSEKSDEESPKAPDVSLDNLDVDWDSLPG
ncbi:MAG: hypothetical protein Tsb009_03930 [Planctomycetaceae bacterium]